MLPFKRTFESEKQQLQQLNTRLGQYLSRTKQLEQENAFLIAEINKLRRAKTTEWEPKYKSEMRDLRRTLDQLAFEKSQAEMERERLWRELQMVQSMCSEQTDVCKDISGELQGCEKELHHAHKTNSELQQRLVQLENEYACLEDAHRQEKEHLRRQVESRMVPIVTQTYRGPPAATVEEMQEYARGVSEGWIETFEMYQLKVEEMEQSIKADQARLSDLQREKMLYAAELDKLRAEAEKQGQVQLCLEEQLMHMQERFRVDFSEYQMIIEQLEHERNAMAAATEQKMREHQHLLQVKMDLGMEVAAYRTLLEGERVNLQGAHRMTPQHQRERIIDIKMPAKPYTPRASILTTRQHTDVRYTPQTSSLRRSPVPPSGSMSPSRVIPISVARHQSPASRRDMISFTKARAAASAPATTTTTVTTAAATTTAATTTAATTTAATTTAATITAAAKDKQTGRSEYQISQDVEKAAAEEKTVKVIEVAQVEKPVSPMQSSTTETRSVKVVSPPMMQLSMKTDTESKQKVEKEEENVYVGELKDEIKVPKVESPMSPSEIKMLESVYAEEIIGRALRPVGSGMEAMDSPPGESKIRYHVEKTDQGDGTTKTELVLESKVEEELDFSDDSALDGLLNQGVMEMSLDDIKDTATGSMIMNLISGLGGGSDILENKSVNVIIEERVDSYSDEELEVEHKSTSSFYEPSSTYFQIEELENAPQPAGVQKSDGDAAKTSMMDPDHCESGSPQVQEVSRESESSYFTHDQEPDEYFVSTPDENLSETEDGSGITSYGHYGIVDDLSDERYYQDESLPTKRVIVEESDEYKFMSGDHSFMKEGFPECIIEEEVRVSPVVQESVLEFLREESLEPKEQLKGTLEKLQSSVSSPLKEELEFLTKVSGEDSPKLAVKKVQQSSDNGTMTIVAELNVSQSLEESGLLEAGDDLSEEQIMATLRSSNLEKAFQGGAAGEYTVRVSREEEVAVHGEEFPDEGWSSSQVMEKHIKIGPSEPFTFQMDVQGGRAEETSEQEAPLKTSQEKKVAMVYLESPTTD